MRLSLSTSKRKLLLWPSTFPSKKRDLSLVHFTFLISSHTSVRLCKKLRSMLPTPWALASTLTSFIPIHNNRSASSYVSHCSWSRMLPTKYFSTIRLRKQYTSTIPLRTKFAISISLIELLPYNSTPSQQQKREPQPLQLIENRLDSRHNSGLALVAVVAVLLKETPAQGKCQATSASLLHPASICPIPPNACQSPCALRGSG